MGINIKTFDQKEIGKACISVVDAMIIYSESDPYDMDEVSAYLSKALSIMTEKLSPTNQDKFVKWLSKKTKELQ